MTLAANELYVRPLPPLRSVLYIVLRMSGSVAGLASLCALFTGEHALQDLSRYAHAGRLEDVAAGLVVADAQLTVVAGAVAPWVSASLVLCVLLAVAAEGRARHSLASMSAVLLGAMAYCPPIQPLAWGLLLAVFAIPAVFIFRARGFANAVERVFAGVVALALAIVWLVAWPELLRRTLRPITTAAAS